jgi:hypothetical protein
MSAVRGGSSLACRLLSDHASEDAEYIFEWRAMDGSPECLLLPAHPLLVGPQRLLGALLLGHVGVDGHSGDHLNVEHDRRRRAAHHSFLSARAMAHAHVLDHALAIEGPHKGVAICRNRLTRGPVAGLDLVS